MPESLPPRFALYADRHQLSEELCLGRLPAAGLSEPVVIAVSLGGLEVGYPFAYLQGGSLHYLPVRAPGASEGAPLVPAPGQVRDTSARGAGADTARLDGVAGRDVVLVDDGLAPISVLLAVAAAIRRGGPRRFVLAGPVMVPTVRKLFVPNLVEGVYTGRRAGMLPGAELYQRPEPRSAAHVRGLVLEVLANEGCRPPDLVLVDGVGARGAPPLLREPVPARRPGAARGAAASAVHSASGSAAVSAVRSASGSAASAVRSASGSSAASAAGRAAAERDRLARAWLALSKGEQAPPAGLES